MKPTTLPRPPITEALIDLRVKLPADVGVERLAALHQAVKSTYPEAQNVIVWTGGFGVEAGEPRVQAPSSTHTGFMYRSADRLQVVQARTDGFTFSRLRPYTDWQHFEGEARALWAEYCRVANPENVHRVAVRYINRIDLPPGEDIKNFIRTVPEVSPDLPQNVLNLLMRIVVPGPGGSVCIITEFSEQPTPTSVPTVFDIDAFREQLELAPNSEAVWEVLGQLRAFKNDVFFNSLTDKALEAYK